MCKFLERGDTLPSIDSLYRLSKNFDISMDWLLFNRGPVHYADKGAIITPPGTAGPTIAREHPVEGGPIPGPVDSPELIPVMAEVKNMLDLMALDPQFRYEVLGYFFKYLKDHPQP